MSYCSIIFVFLIISRKIHFVSKTFNFIIIIKQKFLNIEKSFSSDFAFPQKIYRQQQNNKKIQTIHFSTKSTHLLYDLHK